MTDGKPCRWWRGGHEFAEGRGVLFGSHDRCLKCGHVFFRSDNMGGPVCSRVTERPWEPYPDESSPSTPEGWRAQYVAGTIDLEELERRLGAIGP
jgi:rubredoxin